jgi:putative SOS response-associated peptidase YedK
MCGAYGFSIHDAKEVYEWFQVVNQIEDLQPRFNLRPGQLNPVITRHSPNHISRVMLPMCQAAVNGELWRLR